MSVQKPDRHSDFETTMRRNTITRPTLKERQRKLREEAILESTLRLMTEKGYAAMTMDDVANDVGISKATLYQHFKSKEELAVNVVFLALMQIEDYIRLLDTGLPAIVRLQKIIKWIIVKRYGDAGLDFLDAEATIKPLLRSNREIIALEKSLCDLLEGLIDAAKSEGHIVQQLSSPVLVEAFLSCIRDGSYSELLREGKCTMQDLETTLIGMISCSSPSSLVLPSQKQPEAA